MRSSPVIRRALLLFTVLLTALVITACSKKEEEDKPYTYPTSTPTLSSTEKPVGSTEKPVSSTPTIKPTEEPPKEPTLPPLSEDQKGLPQDNAEVLYEETFANNSISDMTLVTNDDGYTIDNSILSFNTDAWYALDADVYCVNKSKYSQYEYHVYLSSQYGSDASPDAIPTYMACFVGIRVPENSIATGDGGFWIAACASRETNVYPSGCSSNGYWPVGAFTVFTENGFMQMQHLLIIDCGDKIFYYTVADDNTRSLFMKVEITSDKIMSYDKDGKLLNTTDNYLEDEGYLRLFNHYGVTKVSKIVIKASR